MKTLLSEIQNFTWDNNLSSCAVIGSSEGEHILGVWFLKFKEWNEKFTHMCEQISCVFKTIKESSRRFFSINDFNPSKDILKGIYEFLIDTVKLQFHHVLGASSFSSFGAFADQEATVSIYVTGQVNKVFSSDLRHIEHLSTFTHTLSLGLSYADRVQYKYHYVNRDRLNEQDSKEYAIVGPNERSLERGITRPSASST